MDLSDHCLLDLNGPDRVSFLQGMASNDVAGLSPGQGIFAAFTDINGKILADIKIFCAEDRFFIQLREPLKEKILAHLEERFFRGWGGQLQPIYRVVKTSSILSYLGWRACRYFKIHGTRNGKITY